MPSSIKWPQSKSGDFITKDFKFQNGSTLPELRLHYQTLGTTRRDQDGRATNAVLLLHSTTGSGSGFLRSSFASKLFNASQPLSAEEYYLIIPDSIGHGQSSKPSDGLRARFPRYGYSDSIRAQHLLLTKHLGVNHLRLILGTSMGAMHTWVWGVTYPDFMDALMPMASLPVRIAGHNRKWRDDAINSIRNDPDFEAGNYRTPLQGFANALNTMSSMTSPPSKRGSSTANGKDATGFANSVVEKRFRTEDANDFAYAFDVSWDYDPSPHLQRIRAPLTAINSADDSIYPAETGILEKEVMKVHDGRAVVLPASDKTIGHTTFLIADCWSEHLAELLDRSKRRIESKL